MDATRVCKRCGKEKPIVEFWESGQVQIPRRRVCRGCRKQSADWFQGYYKKNRSKLLAYRRQVKFGITAEEFDARLAAQNGVCAICKGVNPDGKQLAVDHNHKTGQLRALLCLHCNTGLGKFQDNPDLLVAASAYLKSYECLDKV